MFSLPAVERAVDLQQRSYKLLLWMVDGVERGFITFDAAHHYGSLPEAAYAWLDSHLLDVPDAARPERDDLQQFANLFATYLEGSFDLVRDPGTRLFSEDAHCFCSMCSWFVPISRLQAKRLTGADKDRARRLQIATLAALAAELGRALPDGLTETLVDDRTLRDDLALATYGRDLLKRLEGSSEGAATLALWRRFAWTVTGSPKRGFELTASDIVAAEQAVVKRLS